MCSLDLFLFPCVFDANRQQQLQLTSAWIGLYLANSSATYRKYYDWRWSDNTSLTYTNLASNDVMGAMTTTTMSTDTDTSTYQPTTDVSNSNVTTPQYDTKMSLVANDSVTSLCVNRSSLCVEMTSSDGSWRCSPCYNTITTYAICEKITVNGEAF